MKIFHRSKNVILQKIREEERKVLFDEFARIVNPDLHLLSTPESEMGSECHVFETLRRCLLDNGFDKSITIDDHTDYISSREYHDIICEGMQLKKK